MNSPTRTTAQFVDRLGSLMDQDELRELPVQLIDADPEQPRATWDTPQAIAEYEATRESIRHERVRQPITVRNGPAGRFILITGENRLRACVELGIPTVPAVVRQKIDMVQVRMDQLIENVRRYGLNPLDLAKGIQKVLDGGKSRKDLAEGLGATEQWLSKRLYILNMPPELQELARVGTVRDIDTLSALASLDEDARRAQIQALQTGKLDGAAVRETARKKRKKKRAAPGDPNMKSLVARMQDRYGAKVRLDHNQKTGKGSITFTYFSLEEFEGLLQQWNFPTTEE